MEILRTKYTKNPIRPNIYSKEQLKIALDDLLIEYCNSLGYNESHALTDFQNTIGCASIVLSGCVLAFSYSWKFQDIKHSMALCVYSYFILNFISLAVTYFKGGKIVFKELEIVTNIDNSEMYNVSLKYLNKPEKKYNRSVFDLFFESSEMDHELFLSDISDLIKN